MINCVSFSGKKNFLKNLKVKTNNRYLLNNIPCSYQTFICMLCTFFAREIYVVEIKQIFFFFLTFINRNS